MTNTRRKLMVLGLLPVVLVTAFLDEYYLGWWWFVLRWSVFIAFLYLWAKVWEAWQRVSATRGGAAPGRFRWRRGGRRAPGAAGFRCARRPAATPPCRAPTPGR